MKNHPDPATKINHVHFRCVNIDAAKPNRALDNPGIFDQIIHPINTAEERCLAATRRADKSSYRLGQDAQADLVKHLIAPVGEINLVHVNHNGGSFGIFRRPVVLTGKLLRHGFRHFDQAYHDKRLRCFSLSKMEVKAISMTTTRKTNAVPYCTRSVYSFCGIFELTT